MMCVDLNWRCGRAVVCVCGWESPSIPPIGAAPMSRRRSDSSCRSSRPCSVDARGGPHGVQPAASRHRPARVAGARATRDRGFTVSGSDPSGGTARLIARVDEILRPGVARGLVRVEVAPATVERGPLVEIRPEPEGAAPVTLHIDDPGQVDLTVGAYCQLDRYGPADAVEDDVSGVVEAVPRGCVSGVRRLRQRPGREVGHDGGLRPRRLHPVRDEGGVRRTPAPPTDRRDRVRALL